jgi:hypothetical protein
MQHTQKLVRLLALLAVVGLPALALPLAADAGVRVSVGIGVPVYPRPSWWLPRRRWSPSRRWLWCGLPWSWLRHRWCTAVPACASGDTIEDTTDTGIPTGAIPTIPTGAAGKGHAPERPYRPSWSRDPEGLFSFRSTPLSIPPYPEAHAPAVCLGTLMWLG